jgi:hypothetical protein
MSREAATNYDMIPESLPDTKARARMDRWEVCYFKNIGDGQGVARIGFIHGGNKRSAKNSMRSFVPLPSRNGEFLSVLYDRARPIACKLSSNKRIKWLRGTEVAS